MTMTVTVQPVDRETGEPIGIPYALIGTCPLALASRFTQEHGIDLEILSVTR